MNKSRLAVLPILLLAGFFITTPTQAATIYQQLTDSSGNIEFTGTVFIGSFISPTNGLINTTATTSVLAVLKNTSGSNIVINGDSSPQFLITGDPNPAIDQLAAISFFECGPPTTIAPGASVFCGGNVQQLTGTTNWTQGTEYFVFGNGNGVTSGSNPKIIANLSNDFYYGYITDGDGASIPIAPGLPGFTDVGIATSSQQLYCYQNHATTTGLLDNVGQSISLGLCNTSVFLFIPSQTAVSQWQTLSSTTRNKIPFSYYYDFKGLVDGSSASSSQNLPSFSWNLYALGIGSTSPLGNILPGQTDLLSSTTISTYLSPSVHTAWMVLISAAIWFLVLLHIYHRIRPHHAKI